MIELFSSIAKSSILPLRTIIKSGGTLFTLRAGLNLVGLSQPYLNLPIAITFTIVFGIVTHNSRKSTVDDVFSCKNKDVPHSSAHEQTPLIGENKSVVAYSCKQASVYYLLKSTNYILLPVIEINSILSGWAIGNALGELSTLLINSYNLQASFEIIGLCFGAIGGLANATVFMIFRGAKTQKYSEEFVKMKKIETNLITAFFLGSLGTIGMATFFAFLTKNGIEKIIITSSKLFNAHVPTIIIRSCGITVGSISGLATLFNNYVSNIFEMDKSAKTWKNEIVCLLLDMKQKSISKRVRVLGGGATLALGYAVLNLFQFFTSTVETITVDVPHKTLYDLSTGWLILSVSLGSATGLSGMFINAAFDRRAYLPETNVQASNTPLKINEVASSAPNASIPLSKNPNSFWEKENITSKDSVLVNDKLAEEDSTVIVYQN